MLSLFCMKMAAIKPSQKKKKLSKAEGAAGSSYDSPERGAHEAPSSCEDASSLPSSASTAKSALKKTGQKRKREAGGERLRDRPEHVHVSQEPDSVSKKTRTKKPLAHGKDSNPPRNQRADARDPAVANCSNDDSPSISSPHKAEVDPPVVSGDTATSKETKTASAAAAGAAAFRWRDGRRWVFLLSYCPLLLVRPRGNSKKEKRQQQVSCLLTADDHSHFLESVVTAGPAGDSNSSSSSKKGVNPVMAVVRRVQAHLSAVASAVSASQRETCTGGSAYGSRMEGPIGARVRECILSEAARVASAAADPNWVAAACMRPDLVHQCLLSFLDSPLVKMLRQQHRQQQDQPVDLLLHTLDGKLLRVSLDFRVPRTFKVFKKVIEKALSSPTGKLEAALEEGDESSAQSQPLIEVLQPPFSRYFEEDACWVALSESRNAPPVSLRSFIGGLPQSLIAEAKAAAGRNGNSASARKSGTVGRVEKRQQKRMLDVVPPAVFVLSAVSSVDSALVPQWQQPTTKLGQTTEERTGADGHHEVECASTGISVPQAKAARLVAVAPHSYPMPASLRLDRLLHELTRAATKNVSF